MEITIFGPVELISISDGKNLIPLSKLEITGEWKQTVSKGFATLGKPPTSLRYKSKFIDGLIVRLNADSAESYIDVCWHETADCQAIKANPSGKLVYREQYEIPFVSLLPALISYSGILSLLLLSIHLLLPDRWFALFLSNVRRSLLAIYANREKILVSFQGWFLDNTNFASKIGIGALVLSLLASISLFVLPAIYIDDTDIKPASGTELNKPNIILIIVDALSAEDMSLYNYTLPTTPNLERITETWTVYSQAYSPTTCSMAFLPSIYTGRYNIFNGFPNYRVGDKILNEGGWVDITQILHRSGYFVWHNGYLTPGYYHLGYEIDYIGTDSNDLFMQKLWLTPKGRIIQRQYFPYMPIYFTKLFPTDLRWMDIKLTRLRDFLNNRQLNEPFFLYYHYWGPHGPGYHSPDYLGKFLPLEDGLVNRSQQEKYIGGYDIKEQQVVDKMRLRYDEAILQQDKYISETIDLLKAKDLYDSSLIIITADHGQNFSNGFSSHCTPLVSFAEVHVPLLIKYPYQTLGKRIDSPTSIIDLSPTFLEIAGIDYDPAWFDGISLTDNKPFDRIILSRRPTSPDVTAINSRWKITIRQKKTYLYDFLNDPMEQNDLFEQMQNDPSVLELKQYLEKYIAQFQ